MNITDLIPWRPKSRLPVRREDDGSRSFTPAPFTMDSLFEDFFNRPLMFPVQ